MKAHSSPSVRSLLLVLFLCPTLTLGQELKPLVLPAPQTDGGKPLMQALKYRHSTREFSSEKLPPAGPRESALGGIRTQSAGHGKTHGAFRHELAGN